MINFKNFVHPSILPHFSFCYLCPHFYVFHKVQRRSLVQSDCVTAVPYLRRNILWSLWVLFRLDRRHLFNIRFLLWLHWFRRLRELPRWHHRQMLRFAVWRRHRTQHLKLLLRRYRLRNWNRFLIFYLPFFAFPRWFCLVKDRLLTNRSFMPMRLVLAGQFTQVTWLVVILLRSSRLLTFTCWGNFRWLFSYESLNFKVDCARLEVVTSWVVSLLL